MAENRIPLRVDLIKNTNQKSDFYGHYYARLPHIATLDTRGFAQHMAEHGSLYTRDVIVGVLTQFSQCLPELLAQGYGVKLDGIGTFYPTAASNKGGAATIAAAKAMSPNGLIKGIHVRYLPEGTDLDNITSRVMKEKCALQYRNVVTVTKTNVDGKVKRSHTFVPVDEAVDPQNP